MTQAIAQSLEKALHDTITTTMLAQNFHWNVTGMAFGPLHALFQEIYEEHFPAQDEIAERIRAIGHKVDGRLVTALAQTDVLEGDMHADATSMISALVNAQRQCAQSFKVASDVAEEAGDKVTEDLCIERGQIHDKFAWILQSHLA